MGEFRRYAALLGLTVVPAVIRNVEFQTAVSHTWLGGFAKFTECNCCGCHEKIMIFQESDLLLGPSVVVVVDDARSK